MNSSAVDQFDWEETKRRIAELGETLARSGTPTREQAEATLRRRAEALAERAETPDEIDDSLEVLTFCLGDESFALETRAIRKVDHPAPIALLPGTDPFVAGMMNFRGSPLLIIDGRGLFGLSAADHGRSQGAGQTPKGQTLGTQKPGSATEVREGELFNETAVSSATPQKRNARLLVLGEEQPEFGLLCDSADQVTRIPQADVLPPPSSLREEMKTLVRGVTADALIVLETDGLLKDHRLWIDEDTD